MPRLVCDQAAESLAEHEDRPQRQGPANREETYPQPANRVPVDGPELRALRVGWQI